MRPRSSREASEEGDPTRPSDNYGLGRRRLRTQLGLLVIVAALIATPLPAAARLASPADVAIHAGSKSYAFSAHQVFVRQGLLASALDRLFPLLAPIQVKCWG